MDSCNIEKVEPLMWEKQKDNYVRCNICYNRCLIAPGTVSRCGSRFNKDGEMELNNFGLISSMAVDPIEKKPLFHFHPGTKVFSVGGWGCNFSCLHCQNWQISQPSKDTGIGGYCVSPSQLVELAIQNYCQGISWTYNEPTIWLEYTIESAKLAKENGLYTAYVTNGFITPEALELIAPYLDAFRVDLKSFSDEFYREICGVKNYQGIYETLLHAKRLNLHIETVTNLIPSKNDSDEELTNIAKWIVKNLGKETPWHVTRFFPYNKLQNIPPTTVETMDRAVEIGKKEGLEFIYRGNVGKNENTYCPNCKKTAIIRNNIVDIDVQPNGICKRCKKDLNIVL